MMNIKKYISGIVTLLMLGGLLVAVPALAETKTSTDNTETRPASMMGKRPNGIGQVNMKPGIVGKVATINGNTLTVTAQNGFGEGMGRNRSATSTTSATLTTYTVDATNATIFKANATSTVSSIVVGDTIMVQGAISGTSVTATVIRDGMRAPGVGKDGQNPNQQPAIQGNGQPVIAGKITAITGSTLTVTNASNVTYTVDATNAKVMQGQSTISVGTLAVGNSVVVQGTVNGNSVTASTILDQNKPANKNPGFFGGIGQFFTHLFGF